MTPYLRKITEYLQRTGTKLTASQVERMFGKPTGEVYVSQILDDAERKGWLASEGRGRARAYRWLGMPRSSDPAPRFRGIGRDGRRVASVWQFAQGRAA